MKNATKLTVIAALLGAPAAHAAFVIEQASSTGQYGNAATGQSFTPSVGMVSDPGASTTAIDLTAWSFFFGTGSTGGAARATTFLLIYDNNPSGSANLIGSSTNSLDLTTNPAAQAELAWTFNNLTLNYTTTYFAVVSSSATGTNTNDIGVSLRVDGSGPYAGGKGLVDNFAEQTSDTAFKATFANPIPEPSTALLGALGMLALLRRRA